MTTSAGRQSSAPRAGSAAEIAATTRSIVGNLALLAHGASAGTMTAISVQLWQDSLRQIERVQQAHRLPPLP